jgi:hypothetical protein
MRTSLIQTFAVLRAVIGSLCRFQRASPKFLHGTTVILIAPMSSVRTKIATSRACDGCTARA